MQWFVLTLLFLSRNILLCSTFRERSQHNFHVAATDAIDVCGSNVAARKQNGDGLLQPMATTTRGQKDTFNILKKKPTHDGDTGAFPYHLPQELVVLCRKGAHSLGELRFIDGNGEEVWRPISVSERTNLFGTLEQFYIKSSRRLTPAQNGNFVFAVDIDGNLLVAPVMQGDPPFEVKHGDLVPGQTPISRPIPQPGAWGDDIFGNHAAGLYRGIARLGGEFDLLDESAQKWVIHQKSGYALSRLSPSAIASFLLTHPELDENDVWQHLGEGCFHTEDMLGIQAMEQLRCYMSSAFEISMEVQSTNSCWLGSDAEVFETQGNLPVLEKCVRSDYFKVCAPAQASTSKVALVEWMPSPEASTCNATAEDMSEQLNQLDELFADYEIMRGRSRKDEAISVEAAASYAAPIRGIVRAMKRSPCWGSSKFLHSARKGCPLQSCLGEPGMLTYLKKIKRSSEASLDDLLSWWKSTGDLGILSFWNARCKPVPTAATCVGHKPKNDYKCVSYVDPDVCRAAKKCYWPPDESFEAGFCLGHKFTDDKDCLDNRGKYSCDIDEDCFWSVESHYDKPGRCVGHRISDDSKCYKFRTPEGCRDKSDCFFQVDKKQDKGQSCLPQANESSFSPASSMDKYKQSKCHDYRRIKCLKESKHCRWGSAVSLPDNRRMGQRPFA